MGTDLLQTTSTHTGAPAGLDVVIPPRLLELHVMISHYPSAQGGQELEESTPLAPRPGPHSDECYRTR